MIESVFCFFSSEALDAKGSILSSSTLHKNMESQCPSFLFSFFPLLVSKRIDFTTGIVILIFF